MLSLPNVPDVQAAHDERKRESATLCAENRDRPKKGFQEKYVSRACLGGGLGDGGTYLVLCAYFHGHAVDFQVKGSSVGQICAL